MLQKNKEPLYFRCLYLSEENLLLWCFFYLSKQRGGHYLYYCYSDVYMSMFNKEKQKISYWRRITITILFRVSLLVGGFIGQNFPEEAAFARFSLVSLKLPNLCQMESSLWCSLFYVVLLNTRAYPMLLLNCSLLLKFLVFPIVTRAILIHIHK